MPEYCFTCDCGHKESRIYSMSEISGAKPKCTACKKNLYRDYQSENAVVAEEPRTIGSLADKNSSRMSDDHKSYLKEKYKSKNKRKNINYGERN